MPQGGPQHGRRFPFMTTVAVPPGVRRFAREWAAALAETVAPVPEPRRAVEDLTPLAAALADSLAAREHHPDAGAALGAALLEAGGRGPGSLRASLRLIRTRAAEVFEVAGDDPSHRVGEVLGEIAAGYADALRGHLQQEQRQLRDTVLRTRRAAEAALWASEERFRTVFTQAGVGIGITDLSATPLEANPALRAMFGENCPLDYRRPITDYLHPEDAPWFIAHHVELAAGQRESFRGEVRFVRPDGTLLYTHLTASLVRTDDGRPGYVVGVLQDVTERHQLRRRLHDHVYHDQLTRLPNRARFEERLRAAFTARSPVRRVGLCHLDLDHFRAINDSLGQQVGDQVLLAVARRLQLLAGEHQVTRTGGDQFAILVPDPGAGHLRELAERILGGLRTPFVIGQRRLSVTASAGIVERAVTETSPGELQRAADTARSWAAAEGGDRWAAFDAERDAGETARFTLAAAVPAAVARDEFHLYYQPLVELGGGRLTGVEALLRWRHPDHGLLGPARFIDLAERTGAIVPLGRWVLTEACRQAKAWADRYGPAAPFVSVNVAPRQLAEPGWLGEVSSVLAETGLPARQLQLEITERAVLVDECGSAGLLGRLREMGVGLTIDDFGTGYSSLSYLRRLPVHGLKIDGSFISGLGDTGDLDTPDGKIVDLLISMAHALDLTVTAEWVETATQARRLAALGCDIGQGHWFGDPMPAAQLEPRLGHPG